MLTEDSAGDLFDPFAMMSGMANMEEEMEDRQADTHVRVTAVQEEQKADCGAALDLEHSETEETGECIGGTVFAVPLFWEQCGLIPDALDPTLIGSLLKELASLRSAGFELPWECAVCAAVNSHCFGSCEICKSRNEQYLTSAILARSTDAEDDHVLLVLARERGPLPVEACFAFCQAMLSEIHNCDEGIYHYSRAFKLWSELDAELCIDTVPVSLRAEADAVSATRSSATMALIPQGQEHFSGENELSDVSEQYELPLPESCDIRPFMGYPKLHVQQLFQRDRFPNIVVTMRGTILVVWGQRVVRARRSEDGGETWSGVINIAEGIHGGGVTIDEATGSIIVFVEESHPPSPLKIFRSTDDGRTWRKIETSISPDDQGRMPSMHMNEHGITLQHGAHRGRLLRATRWYADGDNRRAWSQHFTNAIFSDDHGATWKSSGPFPCMGTGEAAISELSDGTIYYNTRRHWEPNDDCSTHRWSAHSTDGGATWMDLKVVDELPDGPQCNNFGLFGGLARLPVHGHDILLFSNCDSISERENGKVWMSSDAGKTWPNNRRIFAGNFVYSALAVGRLGTASEGWIYCFFEGPAMSGHVARFNLSWLLNVESSQDQAGAGGCINLLPDEVREMTP